MTLLLEKKPDVLEGVLTKTEPVIRDMKMALNAIALSDEDKNLIAQKRGLTCSTEIDFIAPYALIGTLDDTGELALYTGSVRTSGSLMLWFLRGLQLFELFQLCICRAELGLVLFHFLAKFSIISRFFP